MLKIPECHGECHGDGSVDTLCLMRYNYVLRIERLTGINIGIMPKA
jgi:hypothetical protein